MGRMAGSRWEGGPGKGEGAGDWSEGAGKQSGGRGVHDSLSPRCFSLILPGGRSGRPDQRLEGPHGHLFLFKLQFSLQEGKYRGLYPPSPGTQLF